MCARCRLLKVPAGTLPHIPLGQESQTLVLEGHCSAASSNKPPSLLLLVGGSKSSAAIKVGMNKNMQHSGPGGAQQPLYSPFRGTYLPVKAEMLQPLY